MKLPLRLLCSVLVLGLVAPRALATWSFVVVNRATGEVCVASATCLGGKFALRDNLAVIVVGKGAAAAQSAIDINGLNRKIIWDAILVGDSPARILDKLEQAGHGHQSRQYGIATMTGPAVTFTGNGAGEAKHGVWGEVGDIWYAIQGNVLAGDAVITVAEQAFIDATGDLGQRIMAGMEAARSMGGDGRCSCDPVDPDSCGSPPPNFTKSAHTAFLTLARPGDSDGVCNGNDGCANGDYYLDIEFRGKASDPDPVIKLQEKYDKWRQMMIGRPDAVLSEVHVDRQLLVADGHSMATVRILLRDIDGTPLTHGGDTLTVVKANPGAATAVPGTVTDHKNGAYSFPLRATSNAGLGEWNIVVQYTPNKSAQLYPPLTLETSELTDLHAGVTSFSVSEDGWVPFTINRPLADAGRAYRILGTFSGTEPGFDLGGLHFPLNRDRFFNFTWAAKGQSPFSGSVGVLNPRARATAALTLDPSAWATFVGERLDFTAWLGGPTPEVTNLVGFEVLP